MKNILVFGMSENPGGIETYIENMVNVIDERDIHFDFLTVFNGIVNEEKYVKKGINIYKIIPFKKNPILHYLQLRQICIKNKYDAIYMNVMDAGSVFTQIMCKFFGLNIIVHSHNSSTERHLMHNVLRPLLVNFSDVKFACSNVAGKFMFGKANFHVIPNAFNFNDFYFNNDDRINIRKKYKIDDSTMVFCHVGRMENQKNPFFLLNIIKEVYRINKNIKMFYIGDGSLKNKIIDKINKIKKESYLSINNYFEDFDKVFIFLGKIIKKDIVKYLSASDIFLLPSKFEGLPIVLLEAQVNGLYCLCSNTITKEAKICDRIEYLNIDNKSIWIWVRKIADIDNFDRINIKKQYNYDKSIYNLESIKLKNCKKNILNLI